MIQSQDESPPVEILLVEDNPGDYRLTKEALHEGKVYNNLHWAKDAVEAIEFLKQRGRYESSPRPALSLSSPTSGRRWASSQRVSSSPGSASSAPRSFAVASSCESLVRMPATERAISASAMNEMPSP